MKTVFMIACCAVLSIVANSECVTVGDARLPEHSPYLVIVVELAGKPLHGVKVDLYEKAGKEAVFSGVTDEQGMVTPPNLAIGDYNIFAALNQAVVSSLQLRIARNGSAVPLSISLGSVPAGASEHESVGDHLQEFPWDGSRPGGCCHTCGNRSCIKRTSGHEYRPENDSRPRRPFFGEAQRWVLHSILFRE